jgi:hypothetical protein
MREQRILKYSRFNPSCQQKHINSFTKLKAVGSKLSFVNLCMLKDSWQDSYAHFLGYNNAILKELFRSSYSEHISQSHFNGYAFPIISTLADMGIKDTVPLVIGDNISEWPEHVFAKTRPSRDGNITLLRLQCRKHWSGLDQIIKNDIPVSEKEDICIFRGSTTGFYWSSKFDSKMSSRCKLMHAYKSLSASQVQQFCLDIGFTSITRPLMSNKDKVREYATNMTKEKISIKKLLSYKFVLTPEGNDVATGLKAVLASTSLPIMPTPSVESWLLELDLVPWKHYAPVKSDYSDMIEVLERLRSDPELQEYIAKSGQEYIAQFMDEDIEQEINREILRKFASLGVV